MSDNRTYLEKPEERTVGGYLSGLIRPFRRTSVMEPSFIDTLTAPEGSPVDYHSLQGLLGSRLREALVDPGRRFIDAINAGFSGQPLGEREREGLLEGLMSIPAAGMMSGASRGGSITLRSLAGGGKQRYRGVHEAPGPDYGAPLHKMDQDIYPEDIYSQNAPRYYGHGDPDLDNKTVAIFNQFKDRPEADVKIYRAVPSEYEGAGINEGDWVTINPDYAIQHGESVLYGDYVIESEVVKAKELWTDGNSFHEWGYHPSE